VTDRDRIGGLDSSHSEIVGKEVENVAVKGMSIRESVGRDGLQDGGTSGVTERVVAGTIRHRSLKGLEPGHTEDHGVASEVRNVKRDVSRERAEGDAQGDCLPADIARRRGFPISEEKRARHELAQERNVVRPGKVGIHEHTCGTRVVEEIGVDSKGAWGARKGRAKGEVTRKGEGLCILEGWMRARGFGLERGRGHSSNLEGLREVTVHGCQGRKQTSSW
jgi:hypothetical protein